MTNADNEITLEAAKVIAAQAGLELTDAELTDLLAGIKRTKMMATTPRALLRPELEPSPVFTATSQPS
jgi:hypothetical protein